MGCLMLEYVDEIILKQKKITDVYRERLRDVPGITMQREMQGVQHNYSYMPISLNQSEFGKSRDMLYKRLKEYNIITRRYFYPLICDYPCYRSIPVNDPLVVARKVSSEIITLPMYPDLELEHVYRICDIIEYVRGSN